jgi:acyl-CoA synthetase (NDP forming)
MDQHHPAVSEALHAKISANKSAYDYLFRPRSILVVGGSNDDLKPGGRVLKNIKDNGYAGQLWVVNPKTGNVMELPTFKTINDVPHGPDLALIAIPSALVLPALSELSNIGTKAVIVLTSGFGEINEAGKQTEKKMLDIADSAGMALIGPNCSGFLTSSYKGKFAGIIPNHGSARVDVISGSGATVDYVMERGLQRGLSFGNVVNLGNSVQMGVEDLLKLYDENYDDESARILMMYMESVKKPDFLLQHARNLVLKGCMVVGIKSGTTTAGQRAAASHTGAMATSDTAIDALFKKAGIIRVHGRESLIDVSCVLACLKGPLSGKSVCIITDAGGPGVMLSDELNRQGLELPVLQEETIQRLSLLLPPEAAKGNPIDVLPSRTSDQIKGIFECLGELELGKIDVIVFLSGNSGLYDNAKIYAEVTKAKSTCPIPIIPVLSSVITCREKIERYKEESEAFFTDEVNLGAALGRVASWHRPEIEIQSPPHYNKAAIASLLKGQNGILAPDIVSGIIKDAGYKLPSQMEIYSRLNLAECVERIGFPLVMKVIGSLHKTEVGGVKVGISNFAEAEKAFLEIMAIPKAEGVLVQSMVAGTEVIMGASREQGYGHLVMFGIGGIYAEVLKDVQFALAPLSITECERLVCGIRSRSLIEGVRGEKGLSIEVLADYVLRLNCLVTDFPQISEIDLNPLKGVSHDIYAVDARIII